MRGLPDVHGFEVNRVQLPNRAAWERSTEWPNDIGSPHFARELPASSLALAQLLMWQTGCP
jgi:hypothetical protein